jgi:hypothetical protein
MNNVQSLLSNQGKVILKKIDSMTPFTYYMITLCSLFILWFTTYFQFRFGISLFFAIIVVLSLSKINVVGSIIFGLIYVYVIYHLFQDEKKISGDVLKETNIEKNGKPFVASKESLQISSNLLGKSGDTLNFSYSFWLYVNSVPVKPDDPDYQNTWSNYRFGDWKSVFYRGNDVSNREMSGMGIMQQYPGVWLGPRKNFMSIVFQNGEEGSKMERIDIENVPLNRWFQVLIVVEGNSVSVYMDGKLENTKVLNQMIPSDLQEKDLYICKDEFLNFVPSQTEISKEYRCPDGCINDNDDDSKNGKKTGFPGFIGEMVYFPYVLTNDEIEKNYHYYKKIVDKYQKDTFPQKVYFPPLVTSKSKTQQTYSNPFLKENKET